MAEVTAFLLSLLHSLSYVDYFIIVAVIVIGYLFIQQRGWGCKSSSTTPSSSSFKVIAPIAPATSSVSNFIDKMKATNRTIVIFYGSQTGTAEDFASRLAKGAAAYGLRALVMDPEECDMELLSRLNEIPNSLAIFCMATYGEGDPTDNAQEFCDWLKQDEHTLTGVNYAVFALGNRTYEHFNATGIFVDKRLSDLGAKRVFRMGNGDDDGNIEEDFVSWQEEMWRGVCEHFGISAEAHEVLIRQYQVEYPTDVEPDKQYKGEVARLASYINQKPPYDAKNPFLAPVLGIRELHAGGGRSCMHIEVDITGSRLRYDCGDHVAVFPMNNPDLVESIGQRLNTDLERVFTLNNVDEESSKRHPFPCPCTFRTALLYYLDLCSLPKTNVLRELAEFAEKEEDKDFLKRISAPTEEGRTMYKEWIVDKHRNILHVLEDLPSVTPPLTLLCELLPRLQARYYSISSSPKMHPTAVHITAVLVDYLTPLGRPMLGVTTSWLAKQKHIGGSDDPRPKIPIYIRRSQFRLPYKCTTPVIMVGPGTGLAPFRGFIQERLVAKREGKPIGETILYFGCRRQVEDYIYRDELEAALEEGGLTALHMAFSRDNAEKLYVQHLMKRPENAAQIWQLLQNGAHFYVCGDAKNMAREVLQVLESIIQEQGSMDQQHAQDYIKRLQNKGRYAADVWS